MLIQEDSLTGDAASMDISTMETMQKLVEIGTNLLKEPVSRVDLENGRFQKIEGEREPMKKLLSNLLNYYHKSASSEAKSIDEIR